MACSVAARPSGSRASAAMACSRKMTASRLEERPAALMPAWRRYATAFAHTSPRTAWWASRSKCSGSRSA